jgi:hypothetical protein
MLPFTKAESWPNIGFRVTAGSSATSLLNAALASSLGFGIFIDPRSIGAMREILLLLEDEIKDRSWG